MPLFVKNTTIFNPLDWLAPHTCRGCGRTGEVLCSRCKKYISNYFFNICPVCKCQKSSGKCDHCHDFPECYCLGKREDVLSILIHDFKYQSTRTIGVTLAGLLCEHLPDFPKNSVIVPLPTSTSHIRERGFDHTFFIAKRIAKNKHLKAKHLFIRTANTVQVGSDRATRLTQAEHAFTLNPKTRISPDTTYILFDDVWTTGASMNSAIKKLREAGAKRIIVTLLATSSLD